MIRIGAVVAAAVLALVGCHRGSADCPRGSQLHGQKPPAGQLQWCSRGDGVKNGPFREWYANGKLSSAGDYADGKMEGKWQSFFDDGALKAEGVFKGGLKDGIWTQYYNTADGGKKNRIEEHHAGSAEIKWTAFRNDGSKWAEGMTVGSRPQGAYTEYYASGKVAAKANYAAGERVGDWSYFDSEGKPSSTPTTSFPKP